MRYLITIFLLLPFALKAQFSDDFSDGNFSTNPAWTGDVGNFSVESGLLRLTAPATTDVSYLSTSSQAVDTAQWDFFIRLTFNPSASNLARVYLMSDQANLEGQLNGYFVQVGNTDDEVSLYKQVGSTTTKIIDGVNGLVNEDPVEINIRVTRDQIGNWQLLTDTSLSGSYTSMGTVLDTTHANSSFFGVLCDYTSTRSDRFYFDDIVVSGSAYPDTIAPEIAALSVVSDDTLRLTFTEIPGQVSAENPAHYVVNNGIGSPSLALQNQEEVTLVFSNAFPANQGHEINVSMVQDLQGNTMAPVDIPFAYYEVSTPQFGDIVLNEFMADPSPPIGLPELEFVEIYNSSDQYFNLNGLGFSDPSTTGTVNGFEIMGPQAYIILCHQNNVAAFESFGRVIGLSAFPALNNTGDALTLRLDSILLDQLTYTLDWYNDVQKEDGGYSIERINPTTPCSGRNNWRASNNPAGGTPGMENSVFDTAPDNIAPEIDRFELVSNDELTLFFSEPMDSVSLMSAQYVINNGISVVSVSVWQSKEAVSLQLNNTLEPGIRYVLITSGAIDCAGNTMLIDTLEIDIGVPPEIFDVVINEIYPIPIADGILPNAEFIEIFNRSNKVISTEGLRIHDRSASSALSSAILLPGEMAIICDDAFETVFEPFGKVISVTSMPSLNNSDDEISIRLGSQNIDAVAYFDTWFRSATKASGGWTLERINPNNLCEADSNWMASEAVEQGTPGKINSKHNITTSTTPKLVDAFFVSNQAIELVFSGKMDSLRSYEAKVDDNKLDLQFPNGSHTAHLTTVDPFEPGKSYLIEIDSLNDCIGNPLYDLTSTLYLHDSADIVINEVLFNPRGSGSDFVELRNTSNHPINLKNWSLGYYDSQDSLRLNLIATKRQLLDTSGYVALNENPQNIIENYPYSVPENLYLMDLPSYSNSAGSIILVDPFGKIMEQFDYSEDMHFALIDNTDGVSLERISAKKPANQSDNWHSASSSDNYATPGYKNSQDYAGETAHNNVALSAKYISPDNDGYQDVVAITYNFKQPGNSLSIKVYNDKGVLVKSLVSNRLIGSNGSFIWDGTNDLGEKALTGIHVILVESFNLKNEKERFRLPVVVATKLD